MLTILTLFFLVLQGGDDEYEYSGDDFNDPYTAEELAEYAAATAAHKANVEKAAGATPPTSPVDDVPETVFATPVA